MRDQRKIDADHLNLLSIFHFVMAGFAILGLGFLFVHYLMVHQFLLNAEAWKHQPRNHPPPAEFFAFFKWFYVVIAVLLIAGGIGNLLSGFFLRRRKYRTFSLMVAALNCLHLPMGLALGIFAFVVLLRDSVRELYECRLGLGAAAGAAPPPPAIQPIPSPSANVPPVISASPPAPVAQGDATGGLIPYKNPHALMAYYAGVFSIIPFFGFFIGIAALWLGIIGLRRRKQQPVIRGSVHAWIGIIGGSLSIVVHLAVVVLLIVGASAQR